MATPPAQPALPKSLTDTARERLVLLEQLRDREAKPERREGKTASEYRADDQAWNLQLKRLSLWAAETDRAIDLFGDRVVSASLGVGLRLSRSESDYDEFQRRFIHYRNTLLAIIDTPENASKYPRPATPPPPAVPSAPATDVPKAVDDLASQPLWTILRRLRFKHWAWLFALVVAGFALSELRASLVAAKVDAEHAEALRAAHELASACAFEKAELKKRLDAALATPAPP